MRPVKLIGPPLSRLIKAILNGKNPRPERQGLDAFLFDAQGELLDKLLAYIERLEADVDLTAPRQRRSDAIQPRLSIGFPTRFIVFGGAREEVDRDV